MSSTDLARVVLPASLANLDELVEGATSAEEQVELGQGLVLLSDVVKRPHLARHRGPGQQVRPGRPARWGQAFAQRQHRQPWR